MNDWQPIETCKVDVEVLVVDSDKNVRTAFRISDDIWRTSCDFGDSCYSHYWGRGQLKAILWMDIPEPPK